MTELSIRPVPVPDSSSHPHDDVHNISATTRRIIDPSDYHQLSPLDALAAQGRLLNKRLNEQDGEVHFPPVLKSDTSGLHDSVLPKFGINDEDSHVQGRRHRIPSKRRGDGARSEPSGGSSRPVGPSETLSLDTLSLGFPDIPRSIGATPNPRVDVGDLSRSGSQASSSQLSLSTSSDGSVTPTESYHATRIYQPPPKIEPPRLRPIIKTQHLVRPPSPSVSPPSTNRDNRHAEKSTPTEHTSPHPFSPDSANTLDRPRLPSLQSKSADSTNTRPPIGRVQSINFSRPYSSRSSQYSETLSTYEVDYFTSSPHQLTSTSSMTADSTRLSVPSRSPDTESVISSPGLGEEEYAKLPRGRRRKSRPMNHDSVFFHSTSKTNLDAAHRWPVPLTGSGNMERASLPSQPSSSGKEDGEKDSSLRGRTLSTRTVSAMDIPPVPVRPQTSGDIIESSARPKRAVSAEAPAQRPSQPSSPPTTKPRYTLHPQLTIPPQQETFNSPTQILNVRSRSFTSSTNLNIPTLHAPLTPEDHATRGIEFHEQMLLPQATHHFQLSAEGGSTTGMLLYSLSLRHGWGCAPNPEKAVEWLHAAAECASVAVDENGVRSHAGSKDLAYKTEDGKQGGAVLALAIYELGQSYMNGWGVEKDKYLALRCFEMSANLGDTDGQWYLQLSIFTLSRTRLH